MFGYTLIRKDELAEYKKAYTTHHRVLDGHRWFSVWTDLDILWEYLLAETYIGDIGSCRSKYAEARGTDDYGNPLKPIKKVNIPKKNAGRKLAARLKADTSGKAKSQ